MNGGYTELAMNFGQSTEQKTLKKIADDEKSKKKKQEKQVPC